MGHGWKVIGREETSRKKCECGQGEVISYVDIEESDYPPFERESSWETKEVNCKNGCKK